MNWFEAGKGCGFGLITSTLSQRRFYIFFTKRKSNRMTMIDHNATTLGSGNRLRDTVTSYFTRYRLALYLFSGAGIVVGVALNWNWNWLAAAGLLPVLAFLPCMLMMFMCLKHGAHSPNDPDAGPTKILLSRSGKSLDPQQ